ncbi:outer membrane beta-barrel protein [Porphyromonas cangingivalis]|uniref:Opacity protein n=1 Tax=Porphyromonas cangingivalis TaxID=36874 RepID=A0A1T4LH49_PORCN|nr:outer membrane beta-barrel protein [Porphyromonas cangingivalis]SJZ53911.1 Opacity protein [Porphyromonas cangingivalis]VEJ02232.1 Uncharacterised protein [Porphyromonas cangingivalis]
MRKRKFLLAGALAALAITGANAQVKDVSITVSPFVEYNWWNDNIALKDSPFWGARVGFGFGPFFELRGTFEKSLNLKNALENKSWNVLNEETLKKLEGTQIDITRVGGEAKLNLFGNALFSPYVTAGTGVQIFDYSPFNSDNVGGAVSDARVKEKQIYVSLGAGLKLSISDRMALSLEARNVRFNMDEDNTYFNKKVSDKDARWGNWAALASLDFYLGGNTTPKDKQGRAYYNLFTDGFRGPKFVLEPGIAFVDFSNKMSSYSDQWFVGGSAGIDLSSLIGIRGFYYQATKEPNKLSFDLNKDMKMYGANIITRLNYPRGIVPYLSLGMGYFDVKGEKAFKKENIMALAGAGIEIPVSRYIALYGTYNAMLMTTREVEDVTKAKKPSDLINNHMYTAGVRINLGVPAKAPVYNKPVSADAEYDNERINDMRSDSDVRKDSDVRRDVKMTREDDTRSNYNHGVYTQERMTKKEFEDMVNRILKKVREEEELLTAKLSQDETNVLLAAMAYKGQKAEGKKAGEKGTDSEVVKALQEISSKLDRNHSELLRNAGTTPSTTTIVTTPGAQTVVPAQQPVVKGGDQITIEVKDETVAPRMTYSAFTGVNFGGTFNVNIGGRGYMKLGNSSFDFVPEAYIGLGNKTGFGLSGNLVFNMDFMNSDKFVPYVGVGLGLFNHGSLDPGTNIIVGANLKTIGNGALFVDYSARNLFKNNQVAVGYRFKF